MRKLTQELKKILADLQDHPFSTQAQYECDALLDKVDALVNEEGYVLTSEEKLLYEDLFDFLDS